MDPSTFLSYISINVELSAHAEVPNSSLSTPSFEYAISFKLASGPEIHLLIRSPGTMNRGKKRNFTESELEILLHEVEMRKHMLFGTLSTGINAKQKRSEWERVCEAVNAVGSKQRTHPEIKKKWSDLKVEVKRRVSAHRRSVTATGGGTGVGELSPFDLRVAALIGDTSGVARN